MIKATEKFMEVVRRRSWEDFIHDLYWKAQHGDNCIKNECGQTEQEFALECIANYTQNDLSKGFKANILWWNNATEEESQERIKEEEEMYAANYAIDCGEFADPNPFDADDLEIEGEI